MWFAILKYQEDHIFSQKIYIHGNPLRILFLYCKRTKKLGRVLDKPTKNVDITLGGFNIITLEPNAQILEMKSNYIQVVAESCLLDHVFTGKDWFEKMMFTMLF